MKIDRDIVTKCIDSEPELPGDMPDSLWTGIKNSIYDDDRSYIEHLFRCAVRDTKRGILSRLDKVIEGGIK